MCEPVAGSGEYMLTVSWVVGNMRQSVIIIIIIIIIIITQLAGAANAARYKAEFN
jgi:hypothetical protein